MSAHHRQRHLECDWCGHRRATVRSGVWLIRGYVWLFCLACRLELTGTIARLEDP